MYEDEPSQQKFTIKNLKVHSLYHGPKAYPYPYKAPHLHDIAMITLDRDAELNDKVKVAKISNSTKWNSVEDAKLTVIGWGLTWHRGFSSNVLREVDTSVKCIDECERWPYKHRQPSDSYICVKPENGKDSCQVSVTALCRLVM